MAAGYGRRSRTQCEKAQGDQGQHDLNMAGIDPAGVEVYLLHLAFHEQSPLA
jgi:hypothetical protein